MIKSVNKHSYIKGRNGKARARAHINYIAHRGGDDREHGGRKFFDRDRDDIQARDVRQLVNDWTDERGVTIHKLILSPGMQEVDLKEYTRQLMDKLQHEKGLQLEWRAVIHDNTEHQHAHVAIMGLDKEGHRIRFDRHDYKLLRDCGDNYLDREHKLERYLDREIHELLRSREYDRGGDERFQQLVYGASSDCERARRPERQLDKDREQVERDRNRNAERDRREFEQFDKDAKRAVQERDQGIGFRPGRQQRLREQQGRLSDFHADYTGELAKQSLERTAEKYPEMQEDIKRELEHMNELIREDKTNRKPDHELDRLLGSHPLQRDRSQHRDSWKTFEADRQLSDQQEPQRDREDRERGDELDRGGGL